MIWARMLAYITGTVDQELLLRIEYLAAENQILRAQIKGRLLLSDAEKATLAGNRPPAGPESSGRSSRCREARHAPGLVPQAHCQQVRRIEVSLNPGVVPELTTERSGWWCRWRKRSRLVKNLKREIIPCYKRCDSLFTPR